MKQFYVYKIKNKINQKIYIGKSNTTKNRFKEHIRISITKRIGCYSYIHKSINKYGVDNFSYEILKFFDNEEDSYDYEHECILLYKSNNNEFGYNLNDGGQRGTSPNEEVRKKISERRLGFKFSEESKKQMSISHLGQKSASLFNDEQIKIIRILYDKQRILKIKSKTIKEQLSLQFNCSLPTIESIVYENVYTNVVIDKIKIDEGLRACSRCHNIFPITNFNKDKRASDGYCGRCRYCEKEYASKKIRKCINNNNI